MKTEKDIAKKFRKDMQDLAIKSGATISIGTNLNLVK
jgi:hypothetical protein